eukprot:2022092-Pyramimonas_sp.AAC.1
MAAPHPFRHTPHTLRGSIGSSTEASSGCVGMAAPRRRRCSLLQYSQLHMVGSFAKLFFPTLLRWVL